MNAYIVHNSEYNILICKEHGYALSEEFLTRHFRMEHDLPLERRQEILAYASQFHPTKPTELTYTQERVIPIPYLPIIDGYQCNFDGCHVILGTVTSITKHCREKHDWKIKDGECWSNTRAQTFYQGPLRRYNTFDITLIVGTLPYTSQVGWLQPVSRTNYWRI